MPCGRAGRRLSTVHWHGLRLENRYDGVPHETQAPIAIGETFTYRVQFPDAGCYWYHPHIREDFGLEMGLYGTIVAIDDTVVTLDTGAGSTLRYDRRAIGMRATEVA